MAEYIPHTNPWLMDSIHKNVVITDGAYDVYHDVVTGGTVVIRNEQLEQEGFEYRRVLCAEDELRYGSCCADCLKFKMHENIPSLKGKLLNVYMYCDVDGEMYDSWYVGNFTVYEDKLSADKTYREVVCYDKMYEILNTNMADWYNTLLPNSSSTTTLGDMVYSFVHYFDLYFNYSTPTFSNRNMVVRKTINPVTLSGGDVLRAMGELMGAFPHYNPGQHNNQLYFWGLSAGIDDGLFPSDTLYPSNTLYPQDVNSVIDDIPKSYYMSATFEDFVSESITGLTIRADSEDAGVTVYSGATTPENIYTIQGNFLLYGKSASELTAIGNALLPNITNRYYRPATIEAKGNPEIWLSQPIRVATKYRGVTTYVLEQIYTGIQALKVQYVSRGRQFYDARVNSITTKFQQLEGKTLKIKADIDGIETEVTDLASQTSTQISQLSDRINLKVSQGEIMSGLASETAYSAIEIMPYKIAVSSSGTFTVDSSNFKLTSSGYCEMGNCMIKGGTISLGTSGSTQLWIDLDRGFQMSDGSNITYLQEGYLSITAYHAYGDRILRFDNNGLTLSDNAVVTVSELNVPNGGVGASKTQRSIYWRKASSLGNDEYVLCGEHV